MLRVNLDIASKMLLEIVDKRLQVDKTPLLYVKHGIDDGTLTCLVSECISTAIRRAALSIDPESFENWFTRIFLLDFGHQFSFGNHAGLRNLIKKDENFRGELVKLIRKYSS